MERRKKQVLQFSVCVFIHVYWIHQSAYFDAIPLFRRCRSMTVQYWRWQFFQPRSLSLEVARFMYRFFPFYKKPSSPGFDGKCHSFADFLYFVLVGFLFSGQLFGSYFKTALNHRNILPLVLSDFFTLVSAVGTNNFCVVLKKTVFPKAINEFIPKLVIRY